VQETDAQRGTQGVSWGGSQSAPGLVPERSSVQKSGQGREEVVQHEAPGDAGIRVPPGRNA